MCLRFDSQVLFLSGEWVREVLHILYPVLLHVWVQRIRHFRNERVDFLHDASAALHLIHLKHSLKLYVLRMSFLIELCLGTITLHR